MLRRFREMNRNAVWSGALVLAAVVTLALSGCAKKQVRQTEVTAAMTAEESAEPPAVAARAPTVRETPLERRKTEPPPIRTAAVESAPTPEEVGEGAGLAGETMPGLSRIHFQFDRSLLTPEAREITVRNAGYLTRNPGVRIRIEGHCDERGTTDYNLALGERRAKSAFQYLMDLGVDPNRMSVVSYGEEAPLDPRHNEQAWEMNRRAEFVEIQR